MTVFTITDISCDKSIPFKLDDKSLTATKGSCIEIKCTVTQSVDDANFFWLKNGQWNVTDWKGTVIYSTDTAQRPVSADFADRVKYIGTPSASWNSYTATPKTCSILICDLKETDNGNYSFRFNGTKKWFTKPGVWLNVKENPCPITFEKPPIVNESDTVTLTCSTLTSCTLKPQIGGLTQPSVTQSNAKSQWTSVNFKVSWQDHGKEITCKTNVTDKYLIRKISLTVEYAPNNIFVDKKPENVVERKSVTLTCSAKGRPDPNFTWFNNRKEVIGKGAVWTITSITESHNGEYYCEANNTQGTRKSNPVIIDVKYVPEVEMTSLASTVRHGYLMNLACNVKRSNPNPNNYTWYKDGKAVQQTQSQYYVKRVEPEDGGVYYCSATNTVGTGSSMPFTITVHYGPRKTSISISQHDKYVRVGQSLSFYCNTEANPAPVNFSWYRYNSKNQVKSSQWKSQTTNEKVLHLDSVQRADEACYRCNAINQINTGEDSEQVCIEVLYAPTALTLSMDTEVREGRLITIRCTVESFPHSRLTLEQTSNLQPPKLLHSQPDAWAPNTLQHSFNVTPAHTGSYTCYATNSEGTAISERRQLVVTYSPKDVTVKARTNLVVDENKSLTLDCSARSFPPVTSFTWMKMTDGKNKILQKTQTFTLKSISPSDSGLYSCEASNDIGTGNSQPTEVKVKYPPKHTKITTVAEHQRPDGTDFVTLNCSSQSYPPVTQYSWYKMKADKGDEKVSDRHLHTVYSDQPGVYYCIAQNEIYKRASDPIHLFDRSIMKTLLILFVIILFSIFLIVVIYRHKRKKSVQQGTANTLRCFGFLGWWNGTGKKRRRINDPGTAEPFRSRDTLLPDQPQGPPNAKRCQPRADSTPASNIHSVYATVNLPFGQQGPPANKIIRQQGGHKQDDSLTYASLDFGNTQKSKEAKAEEDVYAKVSKQNSPNKNDERLEDCENAGAPMNYETDTSEDEVQLNYSRVTFKAKPGHQPVGRSSSSFDEDETQYSEVKI